MNPRAVVAGAFVVAIVMGMAAMLLLRASRIGGPGDAGEPAMVEPRAPTPTPPLDDPPEPPPAPAPAVEPPPQRPLQPQGKPLPDGVRKLLERSGAMVEEGAVDVPVSVWPLSKEGIRGAVEEVLPHVRACYDQALTEVPDLEGKLVVSFRIVDEDGLGQVWEAGIDDDRLDDGPVADCVLDAMEALQFDAPPDGELSVTYPIVFAQED